MARRLSYTGDPVLTAELVAQWCREHVDDLQRELVEGVIVPAVTQMCESETGAAIREAQYQEDWTAAERADGVLDVGQVKSITSVQILRAGAAPEPFTDYELSQDQRVAWLEFPGGRPAGALRVQYLAGVDLDAYPAVKTWLLLQAGTLYQQRESLIVGGTVTDLPLKFLGHMLAEIVVPTRF